MIDIIKTSGWIRFVNQDTGIITDRPALDITIEKTFETSTSYTVKYNRRFIDCLKQVEYTDFTLNGVPFASQNDFEDWISANCRVISGGSSDLTPVTDLLEGSERPIDVIESIVNGSTDSGVQSVSILFRGNGGSIDGVGVPNNASFSFSPNKGDDTVGSINYTVPTAGEQRVIITYVRVS